MNKDVFQRILRKHCPYCNSSDIKDAAPGQWLLGEALATCLFEWKCLDCYRTWEVIEQTIPIAVNLDDGETDAEKETQLPFGDDDCHNPLHGRQRRG